MEPTTLQDAIVYFSNPANCRNYVVVRRWPNGVTCPRCGSPKVSFSEKHNRWQCNVHHSLRQFTAKTGTIFEDSPLGLDKWLLAMWQVVNCKNGVSSYEIHRATGVTQKTAWFMNHRIRLALRMGSLAIALALFSWLGTAVVKLEPAAIAVLAMLVSVTAEAVAVNGWTQKVLRSMPENTPAAPTAPSVSAPPFGNRSDTTPSIVGQKKVLPTP